MEDPLQGKDTADGLALEERLNSRDIPQVCLDALQTVGVVDAECGRGGNIGGDEFEGRVELQQQLGELLSYKTWRLSADSCVIEEEAGAAARDLPPAPVMRTVLTWLGSLRAS